MKKNSLVRSTGIALFVVVASFTLASCGSSTTPTTTTTTTVLHQQPSAAVWPFYDSGVRYITPVAAAQSFATQYLSMSLPVASAFVASDSKSGSVAVHPVGVAYVTTINVKQVLGDGTWWVLSATTPNIQISVPTNLASVQSPLTISGQSTAFEAVVNVRLRADGSLVPLANTRVMGGSNGVMGPFSGSFPYIATTAASGALTMYTISPRDGQIVEASVVRVHF